MTSPGQQLVRLWDAEAFALTQWDGQATGVYQTAGEPLVRDRVVQAQWEHDPAWRTTFVASAWRPPVDGRATLTFSWSGQSLPGVIERDGLTLVNLDLRQTMEGILFERYRRERRPWVSRCPLPYHRLIPRALRRPIKQAMSWLNAGHRPEQFPQWPVDGSLLNLAQIARPGLARGTWPDGRPFALALTHDVESPEGLAAAEHMATVEEDHGLRSTWFIVGRLAAQARGLADRLKAAGHEIALHGVEHDLALPFLAPGQIDQRLDSCKGFMGDYGIRGFRSPALLHTDALYAALEGRFAYDSSAVDTGRQSPHPGPTGCGSLFPFRRGGLVVVPITLALDSALLFMGSDWPDVVEQWKAKAEVVRGERAAVVLDTHPEPHFSGSKDGLAAYAEFVEHAAAWPDAWAVTLSALLEGVAP